MEWVWKMAGWRDMNVTLCSGGAGVVMAGVIGAFLTDDHQELLQMMHPNVVFSDPIHKGDITSREMLRRCSLIMTGFNGVSNKSWFVG